MHALTDAATDVGLEAAEIEATIRSAIQRVAQA